MSKPAARLGDMHTCPLSTPGVPPIPHVGGPILTSALPQVMIEGQPAACIGDMLLCVGPPDVVVSGAYSVLAGGKPLARMGDQTGHGGVIVQGAATVLVGEATPNVPTRGGKPVIIVSRVDSSWIAIELVDHEGNPLAGETFQITLPDNKMVEGTLDQHGKVRIEGILEGECSVKFPRLDGTSWKRA